MFVEWQCNIIIMKCSCLFRVYTGREVSKACHACFTVPGSRLYPGNTGSGTGLTATSFGHVSAGIAVLGTCTQPVNPRYMCVCVSAEYGFTRLSSPSLSLGGYQQRNGYV